MNNLKGGEEDEDGEEGEEEGEEDIYDDEEEEEQYSGSHVDLADDQARTNPYFGARQNTDRQMYTEANDDADDNLNQDTNNSSRGRRNQLILPEYDDDGNQVSAISFNNDPWTTRNDITAQSSSQHGILANNNSH